MKNIKKCKYDMTTDYADAQNNLQYYMI